MKEITIKYSRNEQCWRLEDLAKKHGFKKTGDCYWAQIFEKTGSGEITLERDEKNPDPNPLEKLEAFLH